MPEISIRQARFEDSPIVLAFCTDTWDWGDYIQDVWDIWLHDSDGLLLVATYGGQPVGIIHMHMQNATDGWIEGMRTDPTYRNQGIATRLTLEAEAEIMRRGGNLARMLTASTNGPSNRVAELTHFQQAGTGVLYSAEPLASNGQRASRDQLVLANPDDLGEIIDYLDASNIFPLAGGIYYVGLTGYSISDSLLNKKIRAGQLYLLRRWERLDGLAIVEPRESSKGPQLFIGYIDGTTEAISLLAYTLRQKASEMGLAAVQALLPDLIMLRDAFTGAEYAWEGTTFSTYEHRLA